MSLQVLFEDNHLIAVNKPAGILVQKDSTQDMALDDMVKDYIKFRYKKPGAVFLGVIHRIDRPVSGVVVFARTSKALTRMNQLFKDRKITKTYWAITRQRPDPITGTLEHYISKDSAKNKARIHDGLSRRAQDAGAKKSTLQYRLISELEGRFLLEVQPVTGRPHQIRVQLAHINCPIIGDVKYGHKTPNADASINLHCRSLSFEHPIRKEPVLITADPPEELNWNLFAEVMNY